MRTSQLMLTVALLLARQLLAQDPVLHGGSVGDLRDDMTASDRKRIEAAIAADLFANREGAAVSAVEQPALYRFVPHGGTLGQDTFFNNAFDLDPTSGIKDFDCTGYTYDGHRGHDYLLRSFQQQAIGVPIFAVLDGTVVDAHDGEPDMNTSQEDVPANYVVLHHTGTHYTIYYHMRKGSVAVVKNQTVSAGTQLGLTGSSGFSNWPHLHFESQIGGASYEPSAGPCRTGTSEWAQQRPLRRDTFAWDFSFGTTPYDAFAGPPYDPAPRVGSFVHGSRMVYFKAVIPNLPPLSTYVLRIVRPDGTVAASSHGGFSNQELFRYSWWWWSWFLSLEPAGQWRAEIDVNDHNIVAAPFDVVISADLLVDRAPRNVSVSIDPHSPTGEDVLFCRVSTSLVDPDPDYDVLRYSYRWSISGRVVREVTSGGFADALPKGTARRGDEVTCSATPSDGTLVGETSSAVAVIGTPQRRRSAAH